MTKEEFKFLKKNFKTKYFNVHENGFNYLDKWRGFHKKILIEFNYDNKIPKNLDMKKIRGFCIDLSHFMAAKTRGTKEYFFIMNYKKQKKKFIANHLNGYSTKRKRCLHTIKNLREFDYLKTLPNFLFGKYIALETFNSIKEQIKFKEHICKLLS